MATRVAVGMEEAYRQYAAASAVRPTSDAEHAERAARLALACARTAGWWRVLLVGDRGTFAVPRVYRDAVIAAAHQERDRARFWRDTASDWRARAEKRPTSDAAGALSNWHELEVSA